MTSIIINIKTYIFYCILSEKILQFIVIIIIIFLVDLL